MERNKKILVIGDSQVGKSTLFQTLFSSYDNFQEEIDIKVKKEFPKQTVGCMVHVHHLNQYYKELNISDQYTEGKFHLHLIIKISRHLIIQAYPQKQIFFLSFTIYKAQHSKIKDKEHGQKRIQAKTMMELQLLNQQKRKNSQSMEIESEDFQTMGSNQNIQRAIKSMPVLVVGCKKDLVDQNRAQYLVINIKVMKKIKEIDPDNQIQYLETGINGLGIRQINHDDFKLFVQKVYGNIIELKFDDHTISFLTFESLLNLVKYFNLFFFGLIVEDAFLIHKSPQILPKLILLENLICLLVRCYKHDNSCMKRTHQIGKIKELKIICMQGNNLY
ncbi:UNKNOWN [Stylonychia lemnae]|uniref:Uncharacterized protein n=1 Tax=Stylonychia lemnae TaxID=5949 RepID=A0A078B3I4_STYLE|nr:UNKNOWN [Stylonychia lemnae]|eukprot:CDW87792.1 UNKNOWN [Stylonychia lemnae]